MSSALLSGKRAPLPKGRARQDPYRVISDRIANALESMEREVRPWIRISLPGVPRNAVSGYPYRDINALLLMMAAMQRGYERNAWLSFRQAVGHGGHIRSGAHGVQIVSRSGSSGRCGELPTLHSMTVFNVAQVSGVPWTVWASRETAFEGFEPARKLIAATGVRPMRGTDPASFPDLGAYYASGLKALVHWTGASARLNRDLGKRFGDAAFIAEQLVGELGAALLCSHLGFAGRLQRPLCRGEWVALIRADRATIFEVSLMAQQAADFILRHKPTT